MSPIPRECFPHESPGSSDWPRPDLPPILLLHEFITLGPDTLELAQRLARKGYAVYVPILFGNEREDPVSVCLWPSSAVSASATSGRNGMPMRAMPVGPSPANSPHYVARRFCPDIPAGNSASSDCALAGILPIELLGQEAQKFRATPQWWSASRRCRSALRISSAEGSLGISDQELATARNRLQRDDQQVLGFRF